MNDSNKVIDALFTIKKHCISIEDCSECQIKDFCNDQDYDAFTPANWNLSKFKETREQNKVCNERTLKNYYGRYVKMSEITEAQVQEYLAREEAEKAKKKAEKELKKAKRKIWIKDHKLTLGAIGVGATLTISKIVKDVLREMNGNKDAASASSDRENAAFCNGYQNGWYDANCAADKDGGTTEVVTTEDAPVE